jgi:hypothetical protein
LDRLGKGLLAQIGAPLSSDSISPINLSPIRGGIVSPLGKFIVLFSLDPRDTKRFAAGHPC